MLISKELFQALDDYTKYNKWQTKLPMEWDIRKKRFICHRHPSGWYASMLIFMVGHCIVCSLFTTIHNIVRPNPQSLLYILNLGGVVLAGVIGLLIGVALATTRR